MFRTFPSKGNGYYLKKDKIKEKENKGKGREGRGGGEERKGGKRKEKKLDVGFKWYLNTCDAWSRTKAWVQQFNSNSI